MEKFEQNKEDMEEASLPKEDNPLTRVVYAYVNGKISEHPYNKNNLKPFSLELAKQGKPFCTRDGRKARIMKKTTIYECNDTKVATVPVNWEE